MTQISVAGLSLYVTNRYCTDMTAIAILDKQHQQTTSAG